MKQFVRDARPDWGPENDPWITDELPLHIATYLGVRLAGHINMLGYTVGLNEVIPRTSRPSPDPPSRRV